MPLGLRSRIAVGIDIYRHYWSKRHERSILLSIVNAHMRLKISSRLDSISSNPMAYICDFFLYWIYIYDFWIWNAVKSKLFGITTVTGKWIKSLYWIIRIRVGSLPISVLSSPSQEFRDFGLAQLLIIPLRSDPQQNCWIKQRRIHPRDDDTELRYVTVIQKFTYVPTSNKES